MKAAWLHKMAMLFSAALTLASVPVPAKTFYIDPQIGNIRNDGSAANPWKTLQEVIDSNKINTREAAAYPYVEGQPLKEKNADAPVRAGDTILLRSGYHGIITISRMFNSGWITIAAENVQKPLADHILLQGASKWRIKGLTVSPEFAQSTQKITLINVQSHDWSGPVREIEIEDCLAYSALNVDAWDTTTWNARSCNGIQVSGRQVVIRNNTVKNVYMGISVSDDSVLVEGNTVDRFDGDGLCGVANDLTFRNNLVKNSIVAYSANHDDGFQSWSVGDSGVGTGTVYRVKLIGNTIIDYTDPNLPLKGTMQGIGCFDGMFEDWDVINNVVVTDHWHGITLSGARNCRIINNTVCDINTVSPGPPWIRIGKHKDGTLSENCVVRNNLTTDLSIDSGTAIITDHNIILKNTDDFFVDYNRFDLRLKAGCAAIDSGSPMLAPATDILGTTRPQGSAADVGAYEYFAGQGVRQAGSTIPECAAKFDITLVRRNHSISIQIVSKSPDRLIHISLFEMSGKMMQDFGGRTGRVITCNVTRPVSGVKLLRVLSDAGSFSKTIVMRW